MTDEEFEAIERKLQKLPTRKLREVLQTLLDRTAGQPEVCTCGGTHECLYCSRRLAENVMYRIDPKSRE